MKVPEPRYVVPCRAIVSKLINKLYDETKAKVINILSKQHDVPLTTDMWTSHAGNGYISLTCHCVLPDFKLFHKNLQKRHLPDVHDHVHITKALESAAEECGIELSTVVAFVTDNGSNNEVN